jgi:hypothetical protein
MENVETSLISIHLLLIGISLGLNLLGNGIKESGNDLIDFLRRVNLFVRAYFQALLEKAYIGVNLGDSQFHNANESHKWQGKLELHLI